MFLLTSLGNWLMGGLRRAFGIQSSVPSAYAAEAASPVTFDTAMQLSAVWACVKLLSETVASLPLTVYKKTENGRKVYETHDLTALFNGKVNRYQNRVEFFETVIMNLVMTGNAYCRIGRAGGRIVSLLPLMSAQVQVTLLKDGSVVYEYHHSEGIEVYSEETVWHLKLLGNGVIGMSPMAYQRNTLGIAQAAEGAVTNIYKNGAKPSGVFTVDKLLTPQQRSQIRERFADLTEGNEQRLLVLEAGAKFTPVSLSPQDIELLESRKFQLAEICRWYGVPSVMVNDNNGTTAWGSGMRELMDGFYKVTLRPLLEKVETSICTNLIDAKERHRVYVEFDFDALLRSDMKSRYEAYRIAIASGFIKPNEARHKEGYEAVEGGDKLLIQGAMVPIDQAGKARGSQDGIQDAASV